MMNLKLLPIFVVMLAMVSTVSFGMEVSTAPDKIIILCKDNQKVELDNIKRIENKVKHTENKPGLGDILQTSQTIKNMSEDSELEKQLKSGSKLTINQTIP